MKDCKIHYEKPGCQFVSQFATGISSLRKEFATLPVIRTSLMHQLVQSSLFATIEEIEG